jgi:RNA polymerase sigma-70 factor (ECF subfamily)
MTGDPFVVHRSLLFTVAYEMLGSAADAEDVLQESWLRWAGVDRSQVRDPRPYLIRVVTRQALNRLRTLSRSREDYVGEWLPEPLLTSPDVAEDVELAESVSIAMLTVLETLTPAALAVFVLRASQSAFASTTVWLNGAPAGRIEVAGEPAAVSLVMQDGRVTRVYLIRNPRKLTRLDEPADLAR